MNIDLCFVPASHEVARKLPAVSGSSGRLVVEREVAEGTEKSWPGRVFEQVELTYTEAMLAFVNASQAAEAARGNHKPAAQGPPPTAKAARQRLRQEEEALRHHRRQLRQQRQTEDTAWRALQAEHKQQQALLSQANKATQRTMSYRWYRLCQQRKQTLACRRQEDDQWHQQRQAWRKQDATLPRPTDWIAILVITDNCTRQCLGLPLFQAGAYVTAELVVTALRVLLPPELLFLISDRGTYFTADLFRALARSEEFIHVLIARHRPQSNGIAERFVRTLKEWLMDKPWLDHSELAALLFAFLAEYNDRPHRGLAIPGLSPNEFANRIWLF